MKTKIAFWIVGCGTLISTVLRCIQMLCFFDYETGFATDSGVFTILYCGVILLTVVVSGALCRLDRTTCGTLSSNPSWGSGITALFVSMFMTFGGLMLLKDAYLYRNYGVSYSMSPNRLSFHIPFAVVSVLFGIAALITAIAWLRGRKLPGKLGVFWAVGILWGLSCMMLTFMTYSASATTEENLFTVCGGATMTFFLLSEGKVICGVGKRKTMRSMYIFGLSATAFWLTYVLSNTILILVGRGYTTEMPYTIQLMMLSLVIHIQTVLIGQMRNVSVVSSDGFARKNKEKRV